MKRFTSNQWRRLASIFDNIGQVVLGVTVISPLITGAGKNNDIVVQFGILSIISFWWLSLKFERLAS